MNWNTCRLDELGQVSRGRSRNRPRNAPHLYGGNYPFIQTGDIKHAGLYITNHTQTYSEAGLAQSKLWPTNTLCITIAANIADTAILSYEACFPDSVIGFIADEQKCDVRFIKYFFDLMQARFKQIAQGAAQDNLSQKKLLSIEIPTPSLGYQRKIVEVLSAYDDLIANNERQIALLEESIHLLYREWFVHLRFPGHESVAVSAEGVPDGWQKLPIHELCNVIMGQSPKSEFYNFDGMGLPFHQGVKDFGGRYVKHQTYCTKPNRLAQSNDILFSVRAPVGRINLTNEQVIIGRGLAAMRNKHEAQSFQYYQLQSNFFKEDMIGGGAIFTSVTKKQLLDFRMLTPNLELIQEFERRSVPVDKQIKNLIYQNLHLQNARDQLLPRLMSGRLEI